MDNLIYLTLLWFTRFPFELHVLVSYLDSFLVTDVVRQLAPKREPNPDVGYCQID